MTRGEKLAIAQGICAPLLRKIRADLQRNVEASSSAASDGDQGQGGGGGGGGRAIKSMQGGDATSMRPRHDDHGDRDDVVGDEEEEEEEVDAETAVVNRLNPRYSSGVSSPGRHVRTR